MTTNHKIYTKLVKNKNDHIGMIAYSIYKREKLAKIKKNSDIASFISLKQNAVELDRYRKEAQEIFKNALDFSLQKELGSRNEYIKNNIHLLFDGEKKSKFISWHNSGAAGIFGNIYTFLLSAFLVYLFSSKEGWGAAVDSALVFIRKLFNIE